MHRSFFYDENLLFKAYAAIFKFNNQLMVDLNNILSGTLTVFCNIAQITRVDRLC
jgi:hypothetical protein